MGQALGIPPRLHGPRLELSRHVLVFRLLRDTGKVLLGVVTVWLIASCPAGVLVIQLQERSIANQHRVRHVDLRNLANAFAAHAQRLGAPPPQLQDLVTAGDLAQLPEDPWDEPYRYTPLPNGTAWLASSGPDGEAGTRDDIVCLAADASSMDACDR